MTDTPIKVKADTLDEFVAEGSKKLNDPNNPKALGSTSYLTPWNGTADAAGKLTTVTLTLAIDVKYVKWDGPKKNKPDKANADAISQMEVLVKAHEDAHRKGYEDAFKKNKDKVEKAMVGKTKADANAIVVKLMNPEMKAACEDLHKIGGTFNSETNPDGTIKVKETPAGPGGCT